MRPPVWPVYVGWKIGAFGGIVIQISGCDGFGLTLNWWW